MARKGSEVQTRIDFRVPLRVKEKFQAAAEYDTGGDLTAFLLAAAAERADRVLDERQVIRIEDEETRRRFYEAMGAEPRPSVALRRLMTEDDPRVRLVD